MDFGEDAAYFGLGRGARLGLLGLKLRAGLGLGPAPADPALGRAPPALLPELAPKPYPPPPLERGEGLLGGGLALPPP